eukprot:jgi/Botrbrau1/23209/Bobra.0041s0053.1
MLESSLAEKLRTEKELKVECMNLKKALSACQNEKQIEVARWSATVSQKSFEHKELKEHAEEAKRVLIACQRQKEAELTKMAAELAKRSESDEKLQAAFKSLQETYAAAAREHSSEASKLLDRIREGEEREAALQQKLADLDQRSQELNEKLTTKDSEVAAFQQQQVKRRNLQSRLSHIPGFIIRTGLTVAATLGAYHRFQKH